MTLLDLEATRRALGDADPLPLYGRVVRASGVIVEAALPHVAVGTCCQIETRNGNMVLAEVVGFEGRTARLMPFGEIEGIGEGCAVQPRRSLSRIPVGEELLGRVVDATLRPMDGRDSPVLRSTAQLAATPPKAMDRRRISEPFVVGIRSIDSCLTIGEGQRIAVLSGPGVGKSVLLGMLARSPQADVTVVGLVGESGREVREFVERDLGSEGLQRAVVVAATSNEPPLLRVRAAMAATAIAEYFRRKGKKVLLLIDSLSRVAMAQREIGLAAGEPPTSKGYPPSVFAVLPRLVERAGNDAGNGSITAFYTVLAEGDDVNDPVADAARASLDGHIVLSRKLSEEGHYPAIDVLGSVSRVMADIMPPRHLELARQCRELLAAYRESADLIEVGAYVSGSNPRVDRAVRCNASLRAFLRQAPDERFAMADTLASLERAMTPSREAPRA